MKVILFSGGVESTALLTLPKGLNDITLTFSNFYKEQTFHEENYIRILNYFNIKNNYNMQLKIPVIERTIPLGLTHPVAFISSLLIITSVYPEVTEIWYGQNSSEINNRNDKLFKKYLPVFEAINPKTKWKFPLNHLSKREQWDMIPEGVRPFVSSCAYHTNCGNCVKCIELRKSGIILPK